jgi:hypothetical protein
MKPEQNQKPADISNLQQQFEQRKISSPYPIYPFYGKVTRYQDLPISFSEQRQFRQPGISKVMVPKPIMENPQYIGSGKLAGKVALSTGGDSGIGGAVAIAFAKEGADVAISYLDEHEDATAIKQRVEELGRN